MKNIKRNVLVLGLAIVGLTMSACNNLKFTEVSKAQLNTVASVEPPIDIPSDTVVPPVEPPVVVPPQYNKTSGACAADSSTSVTSCLKCKVPSIPSTEPVLSQKASNLLEIMTLACQVPNKFDPVGYKAPSRSQILARISRCTNDLYPESATTKGQKKTINGLLDLNNGELRTRLFSKYFISPPDSNYFETYFGFDGQEVRQVFCGGGAAPSNDLYAPQYMQSITTPWDAGIPVAYKNGNVYRNQLKKCMHESDVNPWSGTSGSTQKCQYEQMSGPNGVAITEQIQIWLAAGYSVGADIKSQNMCGSITDVSQIVNASGDVAIGAYRCQ